jgi:hypothetical protein
MSADLASVGIESARCPECGQIGEFGYRCRDGTMRWFCAEHRLAQFWADARMPSPPSNHRGELTDENARQQADSAAAERAGGDLPLAMNGPPWDRPIASLDDQLVLRPAGPRSRPAPIATDRAPHFDEAGRFIHPCCECGRDAHVGVGVNLRGGQLGRWFCATCKPTARETHDDA